jgi:hypothetical protein
LLEITWNEDVLAALKKDLELKLPVTVRVYNRLARRGNKLYRGAASSDGHEAHYTPGVHQCHVEAGAAEGLSGMEMKKALIFTVLHEFRHFHQHEHWDPLKLKAMELIPYEIRPDEIDANEWAKQNERVYRNLLTIKRKQPNSRFGRLSQAQERAKR